MNNFGFGTGGPLSRFGIHGLASALDDDDTARSLRRGRPQAEYRQPLPPEQAEPLSRTLLNHGTSGLQYVLGSLDKPGRAVRGLLAGKPHEALSAIPFSDTLGLTNEADATSGRDLLDYHGLTEKGSDGWAPWLGGMATEIALDPLTYASLGTKAALTPAGVLARKSGALGKMTRAERIGGGLSGLAGVGIPFRDPSLVFGTGAKAAQVAGGLDKAQDAALYGNKLGLMLGSAFDSRRRGAADAITAKAMVNYGSPAREALENAGRQQHRGFVSSLNGLVKEGVFPERDILSASRAAAEGAPGLGVHPDLWAKVQPIGDKARQFGEHQLAEGQRLGLPAKNLDDLFAQYVPRSALALPVHGQQLRAGNLVPTMSGANRSRETLLREIPGGTEAFNNWAKRFAGFDAGDIPSVAGTIRKEMDDQLRALGNQLDPGMAEALDDKALSLAQRISGLDPKYKDLGGFFTPDIAGDLARRAGKHTETASSAHAIYGAIKDNAKDFATLPPGAVNVPDLLSALKLTNTKGSKKAGVLAQGAFQKSLEALGIDTTAMRFSNKRMRNTLKGYGVTAEHANQLQRAYNKWNAHPSVGEPLRGFDSITNAFKNMAYSIWPASHARNALSAFVTNTVNGTPVSAHKLSYRVMRDVAGADELRNVFTHLPPGLDDAAARDWVKGQAYQHAKIFGGHNGATDLAGKEAQVLAGKRITPMTPGEDRVGPTGSFIGDVANLAKEGLVGTKETDAKFATSPKSLFGQAGVGGGPIDWATGNKAGPRTHDTWSPLAAGRTAGSNIEDFFRLANYVGGIKQGYAPVEAGRNVNRLHFDYDALAPFEKNVMRRLVPFYTFGRKNLPLQLDRMIHHPASISAQLRPAKPTNQDQFTPEHLASGIAIPVGKETDGQQRYISQLGLPVEEAFERLKFKDNLPDIRGTAMAYAGMMNPLIKGPLEQLFNTQFHSGRKLSDLRPTAFGKTIGSLGGYLGDDSSNLVTQAIANTPATRFATSFDKLLDERKDPLSKAMNLLTGVKVSDVDTEKARAVETRNALEDILNRDPSIAKYTNFYVRPGERPNLTPAEIERMRMLSLLQQNARNAAEAQRQKPNL